MNPRCRLGLTLLLGTSIPAPGGPGDVDHPFGTLGLPTQPQTGAGVGVALTRDPEGPVRDCVIPGARVVVVPGFLGTGRRTASSARVEPPAIRMPGASNINTNANGLVSCFAATLRTWRAAVPKRST